MTILDVSLDGNSLSTSTSGFSSAKISRGKIILKTYIIGVILSVMKPKNDNKVAYRHPKDLPKEEKMVSVSARVSESVSKRLSDLATEHDQTVSRLITHAIEVYLHEVNEHPDDR